MHIGIIAFYNVAHNGIQLFCCKSVAVDLGAHMAQGVDRFEVCDDKLIAINYTERFYCAIR